MIKRQMFGRAGLPLLRKRVLLTAQSWPAPLSRPGRLAPGRQGVSSPEPASGDGSG
jgi:hypothetical protein